MRKGILFVLSGPSGVGKGTVCTKLRTKQPNLVYSVSATTRKPRPGEVDGINYFFHTRESFEAMIENQALLEHAEYVGNYYGTPRAFVEQTLASGKDVILEIEVQGALQVKERFPQGVFIFLLPPTLSELQSRIVGRGTESEAKIRERLKMAEQELSMVEHYEYAVVNDAIDDTVMRIQNIIEAEHCRRERVELPSIEHVIQ